LNDRKTISREELQGKIERGDRFLLFEVLPEPYYRKHHLPGAQLMPPNEVLPTAQRLAPDRSAEIVLYCWDDH
jgi:rhodanese-related sulfurtransferase